MKWMPIARYGLTALWLTLLVGCSDLGLKKPEVKLVSIAAGKTTLLSQDLTLTLRVQNPNAQVLHAQGMTFDLQANGQAIASGQSNQPIEIPAMGEGLVPLTVHTSLLDWLQLIGAAAQQGQKTLRYQINGHLDGLNGWGRVPFSRSGEWPLPH